MNPEMILRLALWLMRKKKPSGPPVNPIDPEPEPTEPTEAEYREGSIEWLQDSLNKMIDPVPPLEVDGKYGPATRDVVREYQRQFGLTVDGWAGPETVASLVDELAKIA
jgi:peptidoglycan hydrolase-like protein with peptidoglycan-binding domain